MNDTPTPPEDEDLAYEMALMATVEALDLRDTDTSEVIMQKLGTLFQDKDPNP
jgi:hypothetical protein